MTLRRRLFCCARYLSLLLLVFVVPLCRAECFGLDGNTMGPENQPCSNVPGAISACCASNRTNHFGGSSTQGATADKCLSNGLCHNIEVYSPSVIYVHYWRSGCTTTPGDNRLCLADVCIKPPQVRGGGGAEMTPCNGNETSETWCCGTNTDCCGTKDEVRLPVIMGLSSSSSSSIAVSTSTPSTSLGSTGTSTPTAAPLAESPRVEQRASLGAGAIAGIAVSVTIAALAILALLILGRRWRRRKAALNEPAEGTPGMASSTFGTPDTRSTLLSTQKHPLLLPQDATTAAEMEAVRDPVETDGRGRQVFELN
ncbi:hypothetical protein BDV95DRAFT_593749 [Massariosphaeria phaeospora]|uniref:Mid2 domain-containing protein n=1 Tax=Massariosphaeria phaeospora TaxID=100035 RepID=A0A7C8MD31_9PLEO|nr:hypothetical protein BDV95DRAFT_593749 [Massariosphaeria phaeospora]